LSGGGEKQMMAQAFKAVLYSELGHSGPEIDAQAAAYAHQERSLAHLAIGPTQMVLGSGDRESSPISPNEIAKKPEVLGLIM
jgi:hypothetical protein